MTQNTSWTNVEKAIYNLNKAKFLSLENIHKAKQERLASLIRPSGYYNQKAKKLKAFADFLIKNYGGSLRNLFREKRLREILLNVHGIGPETADSIILYAAEKPIFVIDAYTRRIFSRIGFNAKAYDDWQKLFMKSLRKDREMFNEYHALIVEHAKRHCKKKPVCKGCPLSLLCSYNLRQQLL